MAGSIGSIPRPVRANPNQNGSGVNPSRRQVGPITGFSLRGQNVRFGLPRYLEHAVIARESYPLSSSTIFIGDPSTPQTGEAVSYGVILPSLDGKYDYVSSVGQLQKVTPGKEGILLIDPMSLGLNEAVATWVDSVTGQEFQTEASIGASRDYRLPITVKPGGSYQARLAKLQLQVLLWQKVLQNYPMNEAGDPKITRNRLAEDAILIDSFLETRLRGLGEVDGASVNLTYQLLRDIIITGEFTQDRTTEILRAIGQELIDRESTSLRDAQVDVAPDNRLSLFGANPSQSRIPGRDDRDGVDPLEAPDDQKGEEEPIGDVVDDQGRQDAPGEEEGKVIKTPGSGDDTDKNIDPDLDVEGIEAADDGDDEEDDGFGQVVTGFFGGVVPDLFGDLVEQIGHLREGLEPLGPVEPTEPTESVTLDDHMIAVFAPFMSTDLVRIDDYGRLIGGGEDSIGPAEVDPGVVQIGNTFESLFRDLFSRFWNQDQRPRHPSERHREEEGLDPDEVGREFVDMSVIQEVARREALQRFIEGMDGLIDREIGLFIERQGLDVDLATLRGEFAVFVFENLNLFPNYLLALLSSRNMESEARELYVAMAFMLDTTTTGARLREIGITLSRIYAHVLMRNTPDDFISLQWQEFSENTIANHQDSGYYDFQLAVQGLIESAGDKTVEELREELSDLYSLDHLEDEAYERRVRYLEDAVARSDHEALGEALDAVMDEEEAARDADLFAAIARRYDPDNYVAYGTDIATILERLPDIMTAEIDRRLPAIFEGVVIDGKYDDLRAELERILDEGPRLYENSQGDTAAVVVQIGNPQEHPYEVAQRRLPTLVDELIEEINERLFLQMEAIIKEHGLELTPEELLRLYITYAIQNREHVPMHVVVAVIGEDLPPELRRLAFIIAMHHDMLGDESHLYSQHVFDYAGHAERVGMNPLLLRDLVLQGYNDGSDDDYDGWGF